MVKRVMNALKRIAADGSNDSKIQWLRQQGMNIGNGCVISGGVLCFGTEPYMITLGDGCLIAGDVHFITHDGGRWVLQRCGYVEKKMDIIAPIKLGDGVYVGTGAYIMPGVVIGSNSIIGAGAVVTKDIPENSVAVGIPARVIKTVEEYYERQKEKDWFYPTHGMSYKEKKKYFEKFEGM